MDTLNKLQDDPSDIDLPPLEEIVIDTTPIEPRPTPLSSDASVTPSPTDPTSINLTPTDPITSLEEKLKEEILGTLSAQLTPQEYTKLIGQSLYNDPEGKYLSTEVKSCVAALVDTTKPQMTINEFGQAMKYGDPPLDLFGPMGVNVQAQKSDSEWFEITDQVLVHIGCSQIQFMMMLMECGLEDGKEYKTSGGKTSLVIDPKMFRLLCATLKTPFGDAVRTSSVQAVKELNEYQYYRLSYAK